MYQLFVRATDGGAEPLVADVPVDVVVLTDSHGLPVFDPPRTGPQGVFLRESDPVGKRSAHRPRQLLSTIRDLLFVYR